MMGHATTDRHSKLLKHSPRENEDPFAFIDRHGKTHPTFSVRRHQFPFRATSSAFIVATGSVESSTAVEHEMARPAAAAPVHTAGSPQELAHVAADDVHDDMQLC